LAILIETLGENKAPLGYIDNAGLLDANLQEEMLDADDGIEIRAFADNASAMAALEEEEIQAFYVLTTDYLETLRTEVYYLEDPPGEDAWGAFSDFVRLNLVKTLPEDVQKRVFEGPDITVKDVVSKREFSKESIINVILPIAASFFFMIATMSAAGYMLSVVAAEKENRTMEVMITSVTPGQLIGGKAFGLLAAALTQLGVYVVAVVVALKVAAPFVVELQEATVPWTYLGIMALFFLPSYALVAAVMVAIGGGVTEVQQGQQIAGILNLFFMLPVFLMGVMFENPAHPALVILTLFPTTAFLTISLRWGLGTIPLWQLGLSWVLIVATTLCLVWAAARIFRAGMLRYGQPLNLKAAVEAIRRAQT
jgi:ABC-2 type transport system permease protein